MAIDTLLFDLDGTILNTLGDLTAGVNYALSVYGCPGRTEDEVRARIGNGVATLLKKCFPDFTDSKTIDEAYKPFGEYYFKNIKTKTKPYDGIVELLRTLKSRGYKLGVVSNKNQNGVTELCDFFFSWCI